MAAVTPNKQQFKVNDVFGAIWILIRVVGLLLIVGILYLVVGGLERVGNKLVKLILRR
jgi:hypothetical protein